MHGCDLQLMKVGCTRLHGQWYGVHYSEKGLLAVYTKYYVYVIAWLAVVFGINSTSNAGVIARGEAECYLLHYKCY